MKKIFLCLIIFSVNCQLRAISVIKSPFEELIKQAHFIVRGNIKKEITFKRDGHIWTRYEFLVEEFIRGSGSATIFFEQPGGKSGDFITNVAGVPKFKPEEHLCLFLWSNPNGYFQILGFTEGSFELETDTDGILRVKKFNNKTAENKIRFSRNISGAGKANAYERFQNTGNWNDFKELIRNWE